MRAHSERAVVTATVALAALAVVGPLVAGAASVAFSAIALFAAAAILAEYFQVAGDDAAADPVEARTLSFSSAVHLAAAVVVGPWAAAVIAAIGVVVADRFRGAPWRRVAFNASAFALAAFAGGHVFALLGGSADSLATLTPPDLLALAGLGGAYVAVNTLLVELIVAVSTQSRVFRSFRYSLVTDLPTDAAEVALGGALALFVLHRAWAIVLLAPLATAVFLAHARLVKLRRQTARALETFANVVDERDPYTRRHSERVAELVGELAERLGLPAAETARLRWAGRLHDLGKVAVDNSVLRKAGPLDEDEFEQMRRHARLSARILRRFEFAAGEAVAVEYHHERYDGRGYYGIERERVPLASHFLAVADTFDAMTSDRPYRRALPPEVALHEIESKSGSQFHPVVAKAFVTLHRGGDPAAALTADELAQLRATTVRHGSRAPLRERIGSAFVPVAASALLFLGIGLGLPAAAAAAAVILVAALVGKATGRRTGIKVARALESTPTDTGRVRAFDALAEVLGRTAGASWAGLVVWDDELAEGHLEQEWGAAGRPSTAGLLSWLLREHDSAGVVLAARGSELGAAAEARHLAVRIRGEEAVLAFLVVAFPRRFSPSVREALGALPDELQRALASRPLVALAPPSVAVGA